MVAAAAAGGGVKVGVMAAYGVGVGSAAGRWRRCNDRVTLRNRGSINKTVWTTVYETKQTVTVDNNERDDAVLSRRCADARHGDRRRTNTGTDENRGGKRAARTRRNVTVAFYENKKRTDARRTRLLPVTETDASWRQTGDGRRKTRDGQDG